MIASGWHTVVAAMRLYVDSLLVRSASLGSPGVDELRWLKPVRPDVPLRVRAVVEEATPSRSRSDRGSVVVRLEVEDDQHDTVMTMKGRGFSDDAVRPVEADSELRAPVVTRETSLRT